MVACGKVFNWSYECRLHDQRARSSQVRSKQKKSPGMVTTTSNAYYILHILPELYLKIDSLQNCEEESWCKHDQRLVWLKIADKERVWSFTKQVVRKLSKFMTLVSFNIICYLSESHIAWSEAWVAFFSETVLVLSIYISVRMIRMISEVINDYDVWISLLTSFNLGESW